MKLKMIILISLLLSNLAISQIDESWKVYDDSEVAIYQITMDQNDLQFMYDNPQSDSLHVSSVHIKNALIDENIDSVGIRIRGNTSRESQKKSFKLSFNTFIKGRKFYSLEKINLNGEHNDPSIARSKICWDFYNTIEVKSTRAAHAAVYINGEYYGLYISIEHIDENFISKNYDDDSGNLWKCLYGADLSFVSNNPNDYKGNRGYYLNTNKKQDDYSKLAEFIDFINNSDDETFRNQIAQRINLLEVLQYFAVNILTGSWDDYWSLTNNYYLYHEPSIDQFHLIPYDYDNTLGISWFDIDWAEVDPYFFGKVVDGPRPLIERLMEVPEFHNLYTHLLEFYREEYTKTSIWSSEILKIKNKIDPFVENDFFRILDYSFTYDDYNNSFFESGYSNLHARYSIKDFIEKRNTSLASQLYYKSANPLIYDISISPNMIEAFDTVYVNCSAFSNEGIKTIHVEVKNLKTTEVISYPMRYSPDINSLDIRLIDKWKGKISDIPSDFQGLVQLVVEDNNGIVTKYPDEGIKINTAGEVTKEVSLNELMSSNTSTIFDFYEEYEDWIEIYNPQDTIVNLSGKYITDKKDNLRKFKFPENSKIKPHEFIVIWCDEDQSQVGLHVNFKLSSNGEFVAIVDNDGVTIVDSVTFPALNVDESFARINDVDDWYITNSSTPGKSNLLTDISNNNIIKYSYNLEAYPNPFNPTTVIEYEIAEPMQLELKIYDVLGREVWNVLKARKEIGKHTIKWNGVDNNGKELSSGIYLLNINGELYSKTIKLMLLR